ncbi:MAG: acyl-CoA dehydrogenase, partial [Acidobacteriia bacterium]|nr:acyl-CoA dehydrogenase [Terriglobia bacterium]
DMVANAKKIGLFALGVAYQKFMAAIEEQQEVVASITDILMNAFAMESAMLRAEKIARSGKNAENAREMAAVFAREAMDTIDSAARTVLAACSEGDALRMNLAVVKRFTKYEAIDMIGTRRKIAARLIQAERYVV